MAGMNLRGIPEKVVVRAKVQAALERIPLKALVVKALEEYLQRATKEGGDR